MELQQVFAKRLDQLLSEKGLSQGEFAEIIKCSRQSINFYISGKRTPDIILAARMAQYLGVSCDYLIGLSNIRDDKNANLTATQLGLTDDTIKFFAGLHLFETGVAEFEDEFTSYNAQQAKITLSLLNRLISHEQFGIVLQHIKRYRNIRNGIDTMAILQDFMIQIESPLTGKIYGSKKENMEMMEEFCLHIISKYFDEIIRDITKE